MNTTLNLKSTRRNVKLNKFAFGTPWLRDLLSKHWFTSSVWNFCRWVADVPPRERRRPAVKSEEKRPFSWQSLLHRNHAYTHAYDQLLFAKAKIFYSLWKNQSHHSSIHNTIYPLKTAHIKVFQLGNQVAISPLTIYQSNPLTFSLVAQPFVRSL